MNITSAKFVKGIVSEDELLDDGIPQIAFIGRSNVGKSSVINTLTSQKDLAKTSSFPGRTQQLNLFLVNKSFYFVDLPGYGFAKASREEQARIQQLIYWYLLNSHYIQKKVVLIIDAVVGMTRNDEEMLNSLEEAGKEIVIVANKVDKLKNSEYKAKVQKIKELAQNIKLVPFSAEKKTGINELLNEILS